MENTGKLTRGNYQMARRNLRKETQGKKCEEEEEEALKGKGDLGIKYLHIYKNLLDGLDLFKMKLSPLDDFHVLSKDGPSYVLMDH